MWGPCHPTCFVTLKLLILNEQIEQEYLKTYRPIRYLQINFSVVVHNTNITENLKTRKEKKEKNPKEN